MKAPFDTVVEEHTAWLYGLVRKHTDNRETAEDIVQEVWLRAFRVYDSYVEDGRIRHWLSRIALNLIRNTVSRTPQTPRLSLDAPSGDDDPLYTYLSDGMSPEEDLLRRELIGEVLAAAAKLPEAQRQVVTFRYLNGLSVDETAAVMGIPKGTVKSKSHYAISEIRKLLGLDADTGRTKTKQRKGVSTMECKEMYKYLFMYAMGKLTAETRAAVAEHLKECKICADIVTALEKLIPTMVFAEEGEKSHYSITFFDLNLSYGGTRIPVPDYAERNRLLEEWNGKIPENQHWFRSDHDDNLTNIGTFDNEGNEIDYQVYKKVYSSYRHKAASMKKVYPEMWRHECLMITAPKTFRGITKEENIYHGNDYNYFGSHVKSAVYLAIPVHAKNIRINRGNGVIDCGTYKFAYVDRYVAEDEQIALDFTYTLD
ncbi:MAG: sigma-70 family RNA polymerase sigma factor [Clostridia bacterium]|nr:sigma-70 family RNA polymerase sigma factor [Clostridia bacterium]